MAEHQFRVIQPGDFISAHEYNKLCELVTKVSTFYGAGVERGGFGTVLPPVEDPFLFARLTERNDDEALSRYSWIQVLPDGVGGWFDVDAAGSFGDYETFPAYELNGTKVEFTPYNSETGVGGRVVVLYKSSTNLTLFSIPPEKSGAKRPVRVAAISNGTLATAFDNGSSVDGVTLATGDRILLCGQTDASDNGIYDVQSSGVPVRSSDAATWEDLVGVLVVVTEGTLQGDSIWLCVSDDGGTLETTDLDWIKIFPLPPTSSRTYVRAATTSNITLSGAQTIDGVSVVTDDAVLVKNQSSSANNGIYTVSTGSWVRRSDADSWDELVGSIAVVTEGTLNADSIWLCTNNEGGTLGATSVDWVKVYPLNSTGSHSPVRAATTGNISLSTGLENGDTLDGVVLVTGDRVLVKDQTAPAENGIYLVAALGTASRATDGDEWNELTGALIVVQEGEINADSIWLCTSDQGGTLNTDPIDWVKVYPQASGISLPARLATTTNITLSADLEAGDTIDGVTLVAGDRVLVKDQTLPEENGIYIASSGGPPDRAEDADEWDELVSRILAISEGDYNADSIWLCTSDEGGTLDTTAVNWTRVHPVTPVNNRRHVRVATTASISLSTDLENGDSIDGVTLVTGDRVLVKDQSSAATNGIYIVQAAGTAARATDADEWEELVSSIIAVSEGTLNADSIWLCTSDDGGTLETDPINWIKVFPPTVTSSKKYVRAATTANISLVNDIENGDSLDGVTLATGDRVLVKNQSSPAQNGVYVVQAMGTAARATDADEWNELVSSLIVVSEGTTNADSIWLCTSDEGGTLETDPVNWIKVFPLTPPSSRRHVRVATTGNISLSTGLENGDSLDGETLVTGDRVLVKDQTAPEQNGIYIVAASGTAARSEDADTWDELVSSLIVVSEGTVNADSIWLCVSDAGGTLETDPVVWEKVYPVSHGSRYPVKVATTSNINLSTDLEATDSIDGVTLSAGDRVLVKNQTAATENGIYVVSSSGAASRATDADVWSEISGSLVTVVQGNTNADSLWMCTSGVAGLLGVSDVVWEKLAPADFSPYSAFRTVDYATTGPINLASALSTVDSKTPSATNLVLVKDQEDPTENGVYYLDGSLGLSRSVYYDTATEIAGRTYHIRNGNLNAGSTFAIDLEGTLGSVGTDEIRFRQVGGARHWIHQPVRLATTTAGTISTSFAAGQTIDGETLAVGDRLLIKDQSTTGENGIYMVRSTGSPLRTIDANQGIELDGTVVSVTEGTTNQDTLWLCVGDGYTDYVIDDTSYANTWSQIYPAGLPSITTGDISDFGESVDDRVSTLLVAGTGVGLSYNDGADSLTISCTVTQYTDELVRDVIGTALVAGTGVSITVNDGADTITLAISFLGLEALTDPGADRVLFWDDSAGALTWLTLGTGLSITGTTINSSGGITGPGSSTDNAIVRWNGTGGTTVQDSAVIVNDDGSIDVNSTVAATSSITETLHLHVISTGTPAAGFGSGIQTHLETDTTDDARASLLSTTWVDPTNASYKARWTLWVSDAGAGREILRGEASGSASMIGFLGANAALRQTGDVGTALTTFGLMSGTPTFAWGNLSSVPISLAGNVIVLQDQKTTGTAGGTFSAGTRTRVLNTEVVDTGGDCSLSSNRFTLTAGVYEILAFAPCYAVDRNQAWLENVTAGTTLVLGSSGLAYSAASAQVQHHSIIAGRFTVAASQELEIKHYAQTTSSTYGFGVESSSGKTEVYTTVFLRRIS